MPVVPKAAAGPMMVFVGMVAMRMGMMLCLLMGMVRFQCARAMCVLALVLRRLCGVVGICCHWAMLGLVR